MKLHLLVLFARLLRWGCDLVLRAGPVAFVLAVSVPVVAAAASAAGPGSNEAALRAVMQLLSKAKPDDGSPLDQVLEHLSRGVVATEFDIADAEQLAAMAQPAGVTDLEWLAIRNTFGREFFKEGIEGPGAIAVSLLELDARPGRELVIRSFSRGNGVYTIAQFGHLSPDSSRYEFVEGVGYVINERGSDHEAYWLEINSEIYLAFKSADYRGDLLSVTRALDLQAKYLPMLLLDYSHTNRLAVDASDTGDAADADGRDKRKERAAWLLKNPQVAASIRHRLVALERWERAGEQPFFGARPCANDRAPLRAAGHYSYETVVDIPVRTNGKCRELALTYFTGANSWKNTFLRVYRADHSPDGVFGTLEIELPLETQRRLTRVSRYFSPEAFNIPR